MSDGAGASMRRDEAARRWALRLWTAQLVIVLGGLGLLLTTGAGPVVVGLAVVALLGVHVWARRSLGRELAEAGRLDDDRDLGDGDPAR